MEQRAEIYMACFFWVLITLLGIRRSTGSELFSSPEVPSSIPPIKQFPPNRQESQSPACCENSRGGNAPTPFLKGTSPHIIFDLPPTSETLAPKVEGVIRSLHPSPSPSHSPNNHRWTMARPPSVNGQAPTIPVRAVDGYSPSSSIPLAPQTSQMPKGSIYGTTPSSNAPSTMPSTPVLSSPVPIEPPASYRAHTNDSQRPAASPTSSFPPDVQGKRYRVPAAAPPEEVSNHLSPSPVHFRGQFPVSSPTPHEASKSYKRTASPSFSHPEPPLANMVQASPPAILHHQHGPMENKRSPAASPSLSLPPNVHRKRYGDPAATPSEETPDHLSPLYHGRIIVLSPIPSESRKEHKSSPGPSVLSHKHPLGELVPAPAPPISHPQHEARKNTRSPSSAPSDIFPPSYIQGPAISPAPSHQPPANDPKYGRWHHVHPPLMQSTGPSVIPVSSPSSLTDGKGTPETSPFTVAPSFPIEHGPIHAPSPSPSGSFSRKSKTPVPRPIRAFPPPPPNLDCLSLSCIEPYTNPPPGSPCACALPMNIKLRLGVSLYTFFPLVSELAQEIADGVFMKQSQVRVMGANAASEQPEKTIVLIDLVPLGRKFDDAMAFLIYERFWHKWIDIKASYFGGYDVLSVLYPGLPPSPPLPPDINMDGGPFGNDSNSRTIQPLGVDVRKKGKEKASGTIIAIVVVSSVITIVLCAAVLFWLLKLKHRDHTSTSAPHLLMLPYAKAPGTGPALLGSRPSSTSESLSSSIATFPGTAKTFTIGEMERATDKFDNSKIIGEGGFGRVYQGTLEDGTRVAVKVLKRDDQQGSREFLAEIEMLSRLHHRNLVKLIGMCTEEHLRCLVYELIPNGSVESHLHGLDKETAPLDWDARMKIALGSARALAYLHEDSSPRVIHRDFKSSNILLEYDYTPKVSDFGLARTALDEGNEHISTRVMGTFGYVAPEYALTGHLLVKSDVYSYGVVLLELLTGRKPVDMSRPPGQENLVAWANPLLTSKEGLESIIDPALGSNFPFDSVAKVAAIASMCVQPEVSHRPFMGEVVQALKLVCNEHDEPGGSRSFSLEEIRPSYVEIKISRGLGVEADRPLSSSEIFSTSTGLTREASESFTRHSSSGPLKTSKSGQFWHRVRGLSGGSMSEDGLALRFGSSVEGSERSSGWS